MYKEIKAKTALNKLKSDYIPHRWDLNIYRGCRHRCQYCFALYSHTYLESSDYFGEIFVKTNIAEVLERKLCSRTWKKEPINLGGVTDSYQPAEETYRLMRSIWSLLIKYRNPAIISTKSKLIVRDIDLIAQLSSLVPVWINATILTVDEGLRKKIEPGAATVTERFEILDTIKTLTKAHTGVYMMPILPMLTDSEHNIDSVFQRAKNVGATYVVTSGLNLYAPTRRHYFDFIKREFQSLLVPYEELFSHPGKLASYKRILRDRVARARKAHCMPGHSGAFESVYRQGPEQLPLF